MALAGQTAAGKLPGPRPAGRGGRDASSTISRRSWSIWATCTASCSARSRTRTPANAPDDELRHEQPIERGRRRQEIGRSPSQHCLPQVPDRRRRQAGFHAATVQRGQSDGRFGPGPPGDGAVEREAGHLRGPPELWATLSRRSARSRKTRSSSSRSSSRWRAARN